MDGSMASGHATSVPASGVPFVGRERELGLLQRAVDDQLAGHGRLVLLSGEPGIGKTRLAEQLAIASAGRGVQVVWGRCYEWEGAPAFWPWVQALRGVPGDREIDSAGQTFAGDAAFRQLLLNPAGTLDDANQHDRSTLSLAAEQHRFQLFDAIGRFVRGAAAQTPLTIALEDLQWADLPSVLLLRFLSQEIRASRVLLLATYRDIEIDDAHPLAAPLTALSREPGCLRVAVRGMQPPAVTQLIQATTERTPSERLVSVVYRETDGNPLFIGEVVRLLADEGTLDTPEATLGRHPWVPDSVRAVIARRLERLSPDCREVLAQASVIGRDFDLTLLRRIGGEQVDVLNLLDEALRAHLVVTADRIDTYRFSHALVQETFYEDLVGPERVRLHLAVGTALEDTTSPGVEPPWAALAWHFSRGVPAGGYERVVAYAEKAGDAAMAQLAWEQAVGHFHRAVDALDRLGSADANEICQLLLKLGDAQNRSGPGSGDAPDARESFLRAAVIARESGNAVQLAQAAIGYAGVNIVAAFGGQQQLTLLEEALEALPQADSPLRVRVLARLAADLWFRSTDNLQRSRAYAEEVVSIAQRLGDPTLIAYALWARHSSGQSPDNLSDRLTDSARLVVMAEQTGDPIVALWGNILQLIDCIEAGDMFGAEQSIIWLRTFDERARIPYVAQRVASTRAMLHLLTGRYAEATPQVERAQELWQSPVPRQHAAQAFLLMRDLGQLEVLTEEIQIPDSLHPWRQAAQAHRMALALERGRLDAARADYETLVADDFTRVPFNQHWYSTAVLAAEAAVAFNDAPRAERLFALMEPYFERLAVDGSLLVCHGPVALYLGQLAGTLGRWGEALRQFSVALAISERLGLQPYVVRTRLARATIYAARGEADDRKYALAELGPAESVARELGMAGLYDRIAALRDRLAPPERGQFGLTQRELDVLRLVAEGLTDIEVAERLYLSRRTVSTHLTSIYTKLNVSSRTAAARFAVDHALI